MHRDNESGVLEALILVRNHSAFIFAGTQVASYSMADSVFLDEVVGFLHNIDDPTVSGAELLLSLDKDGPLLSLPDTDIAFQLLDVSPIDGLFSSSEDDSKDHHSAATDSDCTSVETESVASASSPRTTEVAVESIRSRDAIRRSSYRQKRKAEKAELYKEVEELSTQLADLQNREGAVKARGGLGLAQTAVWKALANRHLEARLIAEEQQRRLREAVERRSTLIRDLGVIIRKRISEEQQDGDHTNSPSKRARIESPDMALYETFINELDEVRHSNGIDHSLRTDVVQHVAGAGGKLNEFTDTIISAGEEDCQACLQKLETLLLDDALGVWSCLYYTHSAIIFMADAMFLDDVAGLLRHLDDPTVSGKDLLQSLDKDASKQALQPLVLDAAALDGLFSASDKSDDDKDCHSAGTDSDSASLSSLRNRKEAAREGMSVTQAAVWKALANRNLQARVNAEEQRAKLHAAIERRSTLIQDLGLLVRKRISEESLEDAGYSVKRPRTETPDRALYEAFIDELDEIYAKTDSVFKATAVQPDRETCEDMRLYYNPPRSSSKDATYHELVGSFSTPFAYERVREILHEVCCMEFRSGFELVDEPWIPGDTTITKCRVEGLGVAHSCSTVLCVDSMKETGSFSSGGSLVKARLVDFIQTSDELALPSALTFSNLDQNDLFTDDEPLLGSSVPDLLLWRAFQPSVI
ncbi:hypothetical protein GQ600_24971 [Phytophthora cactorum]|nr:hypothetical protein GQ600_24971 [Phytophthora cactorum]